MHLIHNKLSEHLSFRRTIEVAKARRRGVFRPHLGKRGCRSCGGSQSRRPPRLCQTLHHYACFSADQYKTPRGYCYHTYPSLKGPEDQQALWSGLIGDEVSTTATDEFPTSLELKLRGKTVENVTGGTWAPRLEWGSCIRRAWVKRGMSLARFADITSTNAARIFGLFPKKGTSQSEATPTRHHRSIDQEATHS